MLTLRKSGYRSISSTSSNFAAVFLASLVLPFVYEDIDLSRWPVLIFGLMLMFGSSILAIYTAEKGKL